MATLWASRGTDMRQELDVGIPVTAGRFEIVLADATDVTTFQGNFVFPGATSFGISVTGDFVSRRPAIDGTLEGYVQDRSGTPQYRVEGVDVDARAAFFALFRLNDTDLFQSLVFAGDDVFSGSRSRDVLNGYGGDDNIWGYGGDDTLIGGGGTDTLYGVTGDDALRGDGGRDWLWGGDGDDRMSGGGSRDTLNGEDGSDYIAGGGSSDVLRGGSDDDTFQFGKASDSRPGSDRRDVIKDFRDGDIIRLRSIDADEDASGNQRFEFIGGDRFSGEAGELRFDRDHRLVQGDTDGDGRADIEIRLSGSFVPDADDFIL